MNIYHIITYFDKSDLDKRYRNNYVTPAIYHKLANPPHIDLRYKTNSRYSWGKSFYFSGNALYYLSSRTEKHART